MRDVQKTGKREGMELFREVGSWGSYWRIMKKSIYLKRKSRGGKRPELGEGGMVVTHWDA